ncbi:kinesin motor protein cin8 [Pseudocyphellaria aurata]|nr:kinesin motor protein cin8 [Pseudocyphellaria aurata]
MTSRSASPISRQAGGMKRKERDFDGDGEETNTYVVVRCRGRNEREVRENSGVVVSTDGVKGKNIEISMGPSALSNKTYHFDKVFSPAADQAMIYEDVVTPILDEMLHGYNCTIFAYGQTGTGKTYTMSGDMSDTLGLLSDSAGIIPRVLHSLFGKLEADEAESSVKCSFIELYNEELRDLLSLEENTKLKIFEDGQKKAHSATIVQGMEEAHIKNAGAGVKLLQRGSHKRQVAATKCNDLSSRSHTVFTVTVYIKRTAENGEDFVSAGKLNLVDLAGSENIKRSGAENKRAAEAGLINKSLLTLGRVINALVERGSHIPYRESKLTRLLQDSLGGRTKTCIIATVSPAKSNLEETISTLDYAFRAKHIRNKPQVNQMISKRTLLRDFTTEIEKLKGELMSTRQRNGIYLTTASYEELTEESESRRILSEEQKAKIETMEANLRNKVQELFALTSNFNSLKKDSESTKQVLDETKDVLEKTELVLQNTRQNLAEESALRKSHQSTEEKLNNVGGQLISTLERTVADNKGLHSKINRTFDLQDLNRLVWQSSQTEVADVTKLVETRLLEYQTRQEELMSHLVDRTHYFVHAEAEKIDAIQELLGAKVSCFQVSGKEVIKQTSEAKEGMNEVLEEIKVLREEVKSKVGEGLNGLSVAAGRISAEVINELGEFHTQLHASYSSLGRDFKNIFEELVRHLNTQRTEADELRRTVSSAAKMAIQAEVEFSSRLDACLHEERSQAATDREEMLSQITDLINKSSKKQESRWESKINELRDDIQISTSTFQKVDDHYNENMDAWAGKENQLVEEVLKSRETLKSKMKNDWTAINERNTSIQSTTKSVHEETIRIVDAQMKDMALQMQILDDFVTRARSQNERHHETHLQSLRGLAENVEESHSSIGNHFSSFSARIRNFDGDSVARSTAIQAILPSFTNTVQKSLSNLRAKVSNAPLKEYVSTGQTPQKSHYDFPITLPRTESHEKLLAKLRRPHSSSSASPSRLPSPNKSIVYNDTPSIPHPVPSSEDGGSKPLNAISSTSGLREIDLNITANATLGRHSEPPPARFSSSVTKQATDADTAGMGPPPLKRHATMESKLPQKHRSGGKGEGRENAVVQGSGRRLRSSPAE